MLAILEINKHASGSVCWYGAGREACIGVWGVADIVSYVMAHVQSKHSMHSGQPCRGGGGFMSHHERMMMGNEE